MRTLFKFLLFVGSVMVAVYWFMHLVVDAAVAAMGLG